MSLSILNLSGKLSSTLFGAFIFDTQATYTPARSKQVGRPFSSDRYLIRDIINLQLKLASPPTFNVIEKLWLTGCADFNSGLLELSEVPSKTQDFFNKNNLVTYEQLLSVRNESNLDVLFSCLSWFPNTSGNTSIVNLDKIPQDTFDKLVFKGMIYPEWKDTKKQPLIRYIIRGASRSRNGVECEYVGVIGGSYDFVTYTDKDIECLTKGNLIDIVKGDHLCWTTTDRVLEKLCRGIVTLYPLMNYVKSTNLELYEVNSDNPNMFTKINPDDVISKIELTYNFIINVCDIIVK